MVVQVIRVTPYHVVIQNITGVLTGYVKPGNN